jgi:hypothetical protein
MTKTYLAKELKLQAINVAIALAIFAAIATFVYKKDFLLEHAAMLGSTTGLENTDGVLRRASQRRETVSKPQETPKVPVTPSSNNNSDEALRSAPEREDETIRKPQAAPDVPETSNAAKVFTRPRWCEKGKKSSVRQIICNDKGLSEQAIFLERGRSNLRLKIPSVVVPSFDAAYSRFEADCENCQTSGAPKDCIRKNQNKMSSLLQTLATQLLMAR